ncbi:DUF5713 family protein [Streptomyces sp. NPDC006798]|uniref:DUF5713 family protein n=1 Tax=Streptomyces sp. NPDC006798 TaxID=3155462 RepID=UPI0033FCD56E
MTITNEQVAGHIFLKALRGDTYYPLRLIEKGAVILQDLCVRIERERPADLPALYALTEQATERFNALQEELWAADSEIETVARDEIATDFYFVAKAYGFPSADMEDLVEARDW